MRERLLALLPLLVLIQTASRARANTADCGATDVPAVVSTDITSNTAWSGTVVLDKPIYVKNGATLTIAPGTIVRGQPRTGAGSVGLPGALIITDSGRLIADGSATNSIIFTTAAVDNNNDGTPDDVDAPIGFRDAWAPGDQFLDDTCGTSPLAPLAANGTPNVNLWGGVVISGHAPNNTADGRYFIAGVPATFANCGGDEPHDNSGRLRFVSIRHAGDELGSSNELSGLTLCSVGDATVISHVEVYSTFEDGFEWFGGTVNGDHLVVTFAGDDGFAFDVGYTGVNQFLFNVSPFFDTDAGNAFGTSSGDKVGEWEGDDVDQGGFDLCIRSDGNPCPFAGADVFNLTAIGSTPDGAQESTSFDPNGANRGVQIRHCGAANLFNSVIVNTGTAEGYDADGTMPLGTACTTGHNVTDHAAAGLINLVCTTLDDVNSGSTILGTTEEVARAGGDALSLRLGASASSANSVNPATFDLVNDDTTFDTVGVSGKLAPSLKATLGPIDPRLVTGGLGRPNAGCAMAGSGLDAAAVYRGAFPIGVTTLWTTDWTALNQGGLLTD